MDIWRGEWKGEDQRVLQRVQDLMALGHTTFADSARHVTDARTEEFDDQALLSSFSTSSSAIYTGEFDEGDFLAELDFADLSGFPWQDGFDSETSKQ